jgi:hypothetical protein
MKRLTLFFLLFALVFGIASPVKASDPIRAY